MDEAVEGVHHFPIAHDDHAHGADAAGAAVGGFEIDDDSVVHSLIFESSSKASACFPLGHRVCFFGHKMWLYTPGAIPLKKAFTSASRWGEGSPFPP